MLGKKKVNQNGRNLKTIIEGEEVGVFGICKKKLEKKI